MTIGGEAKATDVERFPGIARGGALLTAAPAISATVASFRIFALIDVVAVVGFSARSAGPSQAESRRASLTRLTRAGSG